MLAVLLALTAIAGPLAPVGAQAPPPTPGKIEAPPDPVVSEVARRLSLGRDLLAVLGDRLTAQHIDEDQKRVALDAQIETSTGGDECGSRCWRRSRSTRRI